MRVALAVAGGLAQRGVACAMNQDVPQPTTATRSPGRGRAAAAWSASAAARRQQAGWVASSSAVSKLPVVVMPVMPMSPFGCV